MQGCSIEWNFGEEKGNKKSVHEEETVQCGISESKHGKEDIIVGGFPGTEAKELEQEGGHAEVEAGQRVIPEPRQDEKVITTEVWHGVEYQGLSGLGQAHTWGQPRRIKRVSTILHYNGQ